MSVVLVTGSEGQLGVALQATFKAGPLFAPLFAANSCWILQMLAK